MSDSTALLLGLLLLAANAFFVGAEFAVMAARRSQIEPRAAKGSRAARTTLYAMENVSLMLACCQLGITICSLLLLAVVEPALAHLLEPVLGALNLPEGLVYPTAFAIALIVMLYLHVVIGEMVPKNIAISVPDRSALLLATPLVWVARVVRPVIWALNGIANGALRLMRVEPRDEVESTYTVEQVETIVEESRREGLLHDGGLLAGALEFSDLLARDVMVPVSELVTVPADVTPHEIEKRVSKTGFSRFPVIDSGGELVGYFHLKDVLANGTGYDDPISPTRMRALRQVRDSAEVEDALAAMQRSGAHLGRVVDAGGRTIGVVFLEDVLEELVGEIRDATRRGIDSRRRAAQQEGTTRS